jgi:hypothetical protein
MKGEYEVFPTSTGENKFTRGVSMPYGNTFNVMPGFDADAIKDAVEAHGPFARYDIKKSRKI